MASTDDSHPLTRPEILPTSLTGSRREPDGFRLAKIRGRWFEQCESAVSFHLHLSSEKVGDAYPGNVVCVKPQDSIRAVLGVMQAQNTGNVLVCDQGRVVGIFTERDALGLMAKGADFESAIETVMTPDPVAVVADATVGEAIATMAKGGYRRLPIVSADGQPVGIVKTSGLLHYIVQHFPQAIYTLPPTTKTATQHREGA